MSLVCFAVLSQNADVAIIEMMGEMYHFILLVNVFDAPLLFFLNYISSLNYLQKSDLTHTRTHRLSCQSVCKTSVYFCFAVSVPVRGFAVASSDHTGPHPLHPAQLSGTSTLAHN